MGIRTTITLDEDALERVRSESRARGESFRQTLNDLLRSALHSGKKQTRRRIGIRAALAIENGATFASTDRDFSRFKGLKWIDPLTASA